MFNVSCGFCMAVVALLCISGDKHLARVLWKLSVIKAMLTLKNARTKVVQVDNLKAREMCLAPFKSIPSKRKVLQ